MILKSEQMLNQKTEQNKENPTGFGKDTDLRIP
jgi:hypothetical protein